MRREATRKTPPIEQGTSEWSPRRLLGILAGAVAVAVLLLGGLAYAVYLAIAGIGEETSANAGVATGETVRSTVARGAAHRDEIASERMLTVPESAAFASAGSGTTSAKSPEIKIPTGAGVNGPAFVMTGFPHTPEGAIGQLAQIDLAVLQSMSLSTAEEVYNTWALPGGVRAKDWWITASVRAFLSSTGMGEVKDSSASVSLEPAAALVKGTDGPDWATVCVLMKVSATYKSEGQIAFAHCERMQWVGGRWMVAPGAPPAPGPATWPGTQLAHEAGWRTWSTDHTAEPAHPGDTVGEH
jgi:osmotically-inducible protein OsmY